MASAKSGFSSARTELRQPPAPECGTCEHPMQICEGTGPPESAVNCDTFQCELGINCGKEPMQRGAHWGCDGWKPKKSNPSVFVKCTSSVCFQCRPASTLAATAPVGGPATHTDVGSAGSEGGNSKLTGVPADCTEAIQMLTDRLAENGFQKRKIAELEAQLTQYMEDVKQNRSLKRRVSELEAKVTQVTESASEKHNALEKEKQELQARLDRQNGIGIGNLSPGELMALYAQSLSTAKKLAKTVKEDEARTLLEKEQNEFRCSISQNWMLNPVTASDGHTYECDEITAWISRCENKNWDPTSPKTNLPLESTKLTPNYALKGVMDTFFNNKVQDLVCQDIQQNMFPN